MKLNWARFITIPKSLFNMLRFPFYVDFYSFDFYKLLFIKFSLLYVYSFSEIKYVYLIVNLCWYICIKCLGVSLVVLFVTL